MEEYQAELIQVNDSNTIELKVTIGYENTVNISFRLEGVQTENLQRNRHNSMKGGKALQEKYYTKKWFYERSKNITVFVITKDICGRWLGILYAEGDSKSLNDYLKERKLRNDNWIEEKQEELKKDWYKGEEVTVPDGGQLPIFHIWGKAVFRGTKSNQFNLI